MFRKKKESNKEWRCVRNTMTTDEGRRLQSTRYTYDMEGMLETSVTTFYYTPNNWSEPEPMRSTKRDAYGLIVGENLNEDDRIILVSIRAVYEKGENGLVQRVIVMDNNGGTIYSIGHHGEFPGRRGLPVSALFVNETGDMRSENHYEYDAYGHLMKTYVRKSWKEEYRLDFQREFQYDERGQSKFLTTYRDGKPDKFYMIDRVYTEDGYCCDSAYLEISDKTDPDSVLCGFLHKYEYRPIRGYPIIHLPNTE